MDQTKRRMAGFTLIEVMIVVVVIGILARSRTPRTRTTSSSRSGPMRTMRCSVSSWSKSVIVRTIPGTRITAS